MGRCSAWNTYLPSFSATVRRILYLHVSFLPAVTNAPPPAGSTAMHAPGCISSFSFCDSTLNTPPLRHHLHHYYYYLFTPARDTTSFSTWWIPFWISLGMDAFYFISPAYVFCIVLPAFVFYVFCILGDTCSTFVAISFSPLLPHIRRIMRPAHSPFPICISVYLPAFDRDSFPAVLPFHWYDTIVVFTVRPHDRTSTCLWVPRHSTFCLPVHHSPFVDGCSCDLRAFLLPARHRYHHLHHSGTTGHHLHTLLPISTIASTHWNYCSFVLISYVFLCNTDAIRSRSYVTVVRYLVRYTHRHYHRSTLIARTFHLFTLMRVLRLLPATTPHLRAIPAFLHRYVTCLPHRFCSTAQISAIFCTFRYLPALPLGRSGFSPYLFPFSTFLECDFSALLYLPFSFLPEHHFDLPPPALLVSA